MHISRNARLALMALTVFSIAGFSIFGAGWATPARADGGAGTVPGTGGGGGGGGASSNATNPAGTPIAACGTGAQVFSESGSDNVTNVLDVGIGSAAFLSNVGGVTQGVIRPIFSPIVVLTATLVPETSLNPSPAGWTDLSCGITLSGQVSDGEPVTYITNGQQVCFDLPVGAAAAYTYLRVGYFDTRLDRWVFLETTVGATQACHSSFRLAPTTFVLFGGA